MSIPCKPSVASVLLDIGCCALCALRLSGEKDSLVFNKQPQELQAHLEELTSEKSLSITQNVCCSCLGILQEHTADDFIEKISDTIKSTDHEFHNFFCSITLPICVLKREHSIWLTIKDKCPSYEKETDVLQVKDVWKNICMTRLAKKLGVPFQQESPFEISLTFTYEKNNEELSFLTELFPEIFKKRKNNRYGWELFTRANVSKALDSCLESSFKKYSQCPPINPVLKSICDKISCSHLSLYMAGRYNKYSRKLSQTPWLIDGEKKMESSVQEKICDILETYVKSDDLKFSSSGREDVDVRMLGSGRPFAVEFINPKRTSFSSEDMKSLQQMINSACSVVQIRDLQMITKDDTSNLKDGEMEKTKSYSALCWVKDAVTQPTLDNKINGITDLVLNQKTPIRVLHRRPLAVRERTIHSMSAEYLDRHHFKLSLKTQAGTYIKEFVHGDFCRTTPNLGSILESECDILALDVENVQLDWPKRIDSAE
ncbi:tRNA pseudouridine synthase Pus10-like isoform X2 [Tubulanus polymorphus]